MEYIVLKYHNIDDLINATNAFLKRGWVLQGGICVSNTNVNAVSYLQAMTKEEK